MRNDLAISKPHFKKIVLTESDFLAEVKSFSKNVGLKMYKQLFLNDPTELNSFKKNLPKCHVSCTF